MLVSCRIDDKDTQGNIVPHGYVREYHLYTSLIASQLATMYDNGQRRLGIAVPYFAGGDTFALDSTGGQLTTQDRENLIALIQRASQQGFEEFLIEMIPEWTAAYTNWQNEAVMGAGNAREWQPLVYGMCLEFTLAVDAAVASTGVQYRMDLLGECANVEMGRRLWQDWCAMKGGSAGSVGFSMVPTLDSIERCNDFYTNGILPDLWSDHAYNGPQEMTWSAFKAALSARYGGGFIIGETNCNDPATAAAIAADKSALFYLLQWPVLTGVTPDNVTQDRLTLEYSAYSAAGL